MLKTECGSLAMTSFGATENVAYEYNVPTERASSERAHTSYNCVYQQTNSMRSPKTMENGKAGEARAEIKLIRLSELEILTTYNAEVRGFLGYYSKADNYHALATLHPMVDYNQLLQDTGSQTAELGKQSRTSLKRGPDNYALTYRRRWHLCRFAHWSVHWRTCHRSIQAQLTVDTKHNLSWLHHKHTELGQRLRAQPV